MTEALDRNVGVSWALMSSDPVAEFLEAAASSGFARAHLQPAQVVDFPGGARGLAARAEGLGLHISTLDPLIGPLSGAPAREQIERPWMKPLFAVDELATYEAAAEVGADRVNVAHAYCAPSSLVAVADAFAAMCERAAVLGIELTIEFIPKYTAVPDLASAMEMLTLAGAPSNGRLMIDTWHHWCAGGTRRELVAASKRDLITSVQVSDAPITRWRQPPETATDRLLPGDGVIPLRGWLEAMSGADSATDCSIDVVCETLSGQLKMLPLGDRLNLAAAAMGQMLGGPSPGESPEGVA